MKKYFTSVEILENSYVGTVFDASTNQELYKSKPYPCQSQAIKDINTFLTTSKPPTTDPTPTAPQAFTNTVTHTPGAPSGQRRCCGR